MIFTRLFVVYRVLVVISLAAHSFVAECKILNNFDVQSNIFRFRKTALADRNGVKQLREKKANDKSNELINLDSSLFGIIISRNRDLLCPVPFPPDQ